MEFLAQSSTDHDLIWASALTGSLAFVGTVVVAWLANRNRKVAKDVAEEILSVLDTGNGHTAGSALARIEETQWRHEGRLDAIEVELRETKEEAIQAATAARAGQQALTEHVDGVEPLARWVQLRMGQELEEGGTG